MRLKQLIKALEGHQALSSRDDFMVRGVSCNSKKVSHNFIFVAIEGARQDGNKFIAEAIEKGARAVVIHSSVRCPPSEKALFIKVKDPRKALAQLAAEFYGRPSRKLKIAGITGTNGKTTISYLIEAILKGAGMKPGVIGTVNYRFKGRVIRAGNTTPGPIELHSILAQMLNQGIDYVVMEVSSHALSQERTGGIGFHSAVFTNLTQDHLDYHLNLENYFQAKAELFKGLGSRSFAVLNNDDAYARRLKRLTPARIITYGIENKSDVSAKQVRLNLSHTEFILTSPKGETSLRVKLIGRHNLYNILAAISWGLKEGLALSVIKAALEKFKRIPGRLERINVKGSRIIFVDYAHTEDALFNVLKSLRGVASCGRIITVFGCGGERDKTKRPKMGRVVSELADYAIITSDNPRSEEPGDIIDDILQGVRKNNYCVIPEREEAIRKALALANPGDIVLLAGKGHEDYQVLKDRTIHFNDREVIKECLRSMNY
ncbi:MAG: UDP-N-acetylmuramoyl-L-alanyl-D-glutamate--2,6-diaminopimelate ligase [Candidatus Omnitrophota bacterium]|jgi:UDP-N-acetylmuramoyl-L-alanyl-D-glutamate--2,6-diaminopimelate ligase